MMSAVAKERCFMTGNIEADGTKIFLVTPSRICETCSLFWQRSRWRRGRGFEVYDLPDMLKVM